MLVLGRKKGEAVEVTVGDIEGLTLTMRVLDVDNGNVKIGFDAPDYFKILRQELAIADRRRGL